jgi:hypothetical protein
MRNHYKVLAEMYEQEIQEQPVSHRKTDFIDDEHYQFNGVPYTIEAGFDWEESSVGHRASIGHHGVAGHDVYGLRPVGITWIEVTDSAGNIVTDETILKDASEYALERGNEEAADK